MAVNVSFSNIRVAYKYSRKYVFTLMLLPPHVSLHEALAPLRRDLAELERGISVQVHPPPHGQEAQTITVTGSVSMLLADHVQACSNCCHLGNNANLNCLSCLMKKEDRLVYSPDVLNYNMTRNLSQHAVMLQQMHRQMGPLPSAGRVREVKSLYGISTDPLPFGNTVDPFTQSFPCVGHAMDLGLMGRLTNFMLSLLSQREHREFVARQTNLDYPRGWTRLPTFKSKMKGRLGEPIKVTKKLGLLAFYLFQGLVPPDVLSLVSSLLELRSRIMMRGHTGASISFVSPELSQKLTGFVFTFIIQSRPKV